MSLLRKAIRVVNSCETIEQLNVADRFVRLALRSMCYLGNHKFSVVMKASIMQREFNDYIIRKAKSIGI